MILARRISKFLRERIRLLGASTYLSLVLIVAALSTPTAHATVVDHSFYVICRSDGCTAYDCLSFDPATYQLLVTSESGAPEALTVPSISYTYLRFVAVPWETDTNLPASLNKTIKPQFLFGYIRLISRFIANPFGGIFAFLLIVTLQVLSAIGRNSYKGLWTILLMPLALAAVGIAGPVGDKADRRAEEIRSQVIAHRNADGHILPMPAEVIEANNPAASDLYGSEEIGAILHIPFFWLLLRAYRGAHYLLVRHPAERFIRSTGSGAGRGLRVYHEGLVGSLGRGDPRRPPPEFVSENQTRRVRKLTERFRAERKLAEEAVRHARAAAANREEKKP